MIHSWRFMLVVTRDGALGVEDSELFLSLLQGAIIHPNGDPTKVPTIPLIPDDFLDHLRDKQHLYRAGARKPAD
jgi:hypothetical protein